MLTDFNACGFDPRDLRKDVRPDEHYQTSTDQLLASQLYVGMWSTAMLVEYLRKSCFTEPSTKVIRTLAIP